jgi:hypothetical protein
MTASGIETQNFRSASFNYATSISVLRVHRWQFDTFHSTFKLTWREHIIKKRKQLDLKTRELKWLIGKNPPLTIKQVTNIQNSSKTRMDLRHCALGLRQQIKHISDTAIPIKTPPNCNKCALVRNQPNTTLRPTHPLRTLRSTRLYP